MLSSVIFPEFLCMNDLFLLGLSMSSCVLSLSLSFTSLSFPFLQLGFSDWGGSGSLAVSAQVAGLVLSSGGKVLPWLGVLTISSFSRGCEWPGAWQASFLRRTGGTSEGKEPSSFWNTQSRDKSQEGCILWVESFRIFYSWVACTPCSSAGWGVPQITPGLKMVSPHTGECSLSLETVVVNPRMYLGWMCLLCCCREYVERVGLK